MKPFLHNFIFFLMLSSYAGYGLTTSMVYNFRIAQVTKQQLSEDVNNFKNNIIGLLFDVYQIKYSGLQQNFAGLLTSYIRNFVPYYVRIDFAFSHIQQQSNHVISFNGTATDDLLGTFGLKISNDPNHSVTLSALFGIPTHQLKVLQHPNFGYSQVGLGLQLDALYNFNINSALIYGSRYLYFIPRSALDIHKNRYKFSASNLFDILVASKTNWESQGLEAGYTARFQFGTQIYPELANVIEKTDCIRSSFYLVYKYRFLIKKVQNRLLFNIGYGFDHQPKNFGNKYIITLWGSWGFNF